MPDAVKIELSATFPGEAVLVKLLDVYEKSRENMDPEIRKGWDKLALALGTGWHNWWVDHGWPGMKV